MSHVIPSLSFTYHCIWDVNSLPCADLTQRSHSLGSEGEWSILWDGVRRGFEVEVSRVMGVEVRVPVSGEGTRSLKFRVLDCFY